MREKERRKEGERKRRVDKEGEEGIEGDVIKRIGWKEGRKEGAGERGVKEKKRLWREMEGVERR